MLVVVAHPDDEAIGMAGVIAAARRRGRRVTVTVATDGNAWRDREFGLRRRSESLAGLGLLGVPREDVLFLGYVTLAGLPRFGRRTARRLARSIAAVTADADEIYTHVPFDGHADHAEIARRVLAAAPPRTIVWGTLMHPPGAGSCLELSASRWPPPAGEPGARFRPAADPEPPPSPACAEHPGETSWGPLGPPDALVEVPEDMQRPDEPTNLKWQAIACHQSQVELGDVSAGYLRAFVRRHEFFWRLAG
jgi:LmbE family N-acetylglucosaminyl deacetylase